MKTLHFFIKKTKRGFFFFTACVPVTSWQGWYDSHAFPLFSVIK